HIGYIAQSEGYLHGFIALTLRYPRYYLESFQNTWRYFSSASDDALANDYRVTSDFIRFTQRYNKFFLAELSPGSVAWILVISFPLLLIFGCIEIRRLHSKKHNPQLWALNFMMFHLIWLSVLTVSVSWGNYNRYRFEFDAFYVVLLGLVFTSIAAR